MVENKSRPSQTQVIFFLGQKVVVFLTEQVDLAFLTEQPCFACDILSIEGQISGNYFEMLLLN